MKKLKIKNSKLKIFYSAIRNLKSEIGLTLIEIMVVIAILAIMSSTLFSLFQGSLFSQRRGTNKALVYSEARAALDMMSREIEQAIVDERVNIHYELWNGPSPYQPAGESIGDEFYFIAPIMGDAIEGVRLRGIGYWLEKKGNNIFLKRYYNARPDLDVPAFNFSDGGSSELIGNVSDLKFKYWDDTTLQFEDPNYPITSGYALPKAIKIILVMQYEEEKDVTDTAVFMTVVDIPGSGQ